MGNTGVLVVDTMLNRRLADQEIALVHAATDKPIRYAVNTSYHSYGNQCFPAGIQIMQHAAMLPEDAIVVPGHGEPTGVAAISALLRT